MKRIKPIILSIALALGAFTLAPACSPNSADAQETESKEASVTLEIKGMVTDNCPVLVKTAVGKMTGVNDVKASLESKTATVKYDPRETSVEKIREVIKDQVGFDTEVAS